MRALALLLVVACGGSPDGDAGLAERAHSYTIPPGELVELRVELSAATTMTVTWAANVVLPWEVHSHPLGVLEVHEQGVDPGGEIDFETPASRIYGVQWSNFTDTPAEVSVTLALPPDAVLLEW